MKAKHVGHALALLAILVCVPGSLNDAAAQIGGSGSINGTVFDPNGAVVPNATVVARNVATGVETTSQTTDAGLYVISALPPGEYTVTVKVSGFQTLIQEKVIVDALGSVGLNFTLIVHDADGDTDAPQLLLSVNELLPPVVVAATMLVTLNVAFPALVKVMIC